jgi:iron-regulated transporter 1
VIKVLQLSHIGALQLAHQEIALNRLSASSRKILWSRFLTHSGDQAWDFVVPLALASLLPGRLELVAVWYLLSRVLHLLLVGRVCALVDSLQRSAVVKAGIGLQSTGVALSLFILGVVAWNPHLLAGQSLMDPSFCGVFVALIGAAVAASLGAALMDVAVSQDFVPALVGSHELTHVNSRLKQIDLSTELFAPIVAGFLMVGAKKWALDHEWHGVELLGPALVGIWNILSFAPEYRLLRKALQSIESQQGSGSLRAPEQSALQSATKENHPIEMQSYVKSWLQFVREPAALSMAAWALVWLTVISPHGVLLTTWLLQNWNLSEVVLGIFRGLGAVFGLLATLLFPIVSQKFGLARASMTFVVAQALCLIVAGISFGLGAGASWLFLAAVLFSRIGLYGFSLGETEIRQRLVTRKGVVNGQLNALTTGATLCVFALGTLAANAQDFKWLIWGSVGAVCAAALLQSFWTFSASAQKLR